jgi:hypothetical protein
MKKNRSDNAKTMADTVKKNKTKVAGVINGNLNQFGVPSLISADFASYQRHARSVDDPVWDYFVPDHLTESTLPFRDPIEFALRDGKPLPQSDLFEPLMAENEKSLSPEPLSEDSEEDFLNTNSRESRVVTLPFLSSNRPVSTSEKATSVPVGKLGPPSKTSLKELDLKDASKRLSKSARSSQHRQLSSRDSKKKERESPIEQDTIRSILQLQTLSPRIDAKNLKSNLLAEAKEMKSNTTQQLSIRNIALPSSFSSGPTLGDWHRTLQSHKPIANAPPLDTAKYWTELSMDAVQELTKTKRATKSIHVEKEKLDKSSRPKYYLDRKLEPLTQMNLNDAMINLKGRKEIQYQAKEFGFWSK